MAEATTIARPYAEAAFSLAQENNAIPRWSSFLELSAAVARHERVRALIGNPRITSEQVLKVFTGVAGQSLGAHCTNFLNALAKNGRLEVLPEISQMFEEMKAQHGGALEATIHSAFPLNDAQLKGLVQDLETRFKRKIEADLRVAPELIGGVKIEIGDQVLDASVRGRLTAMAAALTA
ncbi:MAG: F0F1 ATP synthase subunit delta [Burkholderiales bacterium]